MSPWSQRSGAGPGFWETAIEPLVRLQLVGSFVEASGRVQVERQVAVSAEAKERVRLWPEDTEGPLDRFYGRLEGAASAVGIRQLDEGSGMILGRLREAVQDARPLQELLASEKRRQALAMVAVART